MQIEGYRFISDCTEIEVMVPILTSSPEHDGWQAITGNDQMWHYMTTGKMEGQGIERTTTETEEGTDYQS